MKNYYADFLQTKISVNTLPKAVSKVSKGKEFDTKKAFDTFDTALPSINQKIYVPKNNDELLDFKAEKLHEILNRFIFAGVTFDVSTDDFQIIDNAGILKTSDREFLELNYSIIICTLQQSLLMKHLFNHSPEQFEDFAFEIREREAIISEECLNTPLRITAKTRFEIYFQAVKTTTRKWFDELLKEKGMVGQAFDDETHSQATH
jgi:hypothetical protein